MGMAGGGVRSPLIDLTDEEKETLKSELLPLIPTAEHTGSGSSRDHAVWLNEKSSRDTDFSGMMLLVSVQDMPEAIEADMGGADIIDVKNLQEALVGSGHPNLVDEARKKIPA